MMNSKAVLYAVFAVALGYLLISVVPTKLSPPESPMLTERAFSTESGEPPQPAPDESIEGIPDTAKEDLGEVESDIAGNASSSSAAEAAKEAAEAAKSAAAPLSNFLGYMLWIADLFIALGVYVVAKRRLT